MMKQRSIIVVCSSWRNARNRIRKLNDEDDDVATRTGGGGVLFHIYFGKKYSILPLAVGWNFQEIVENFIVPT